MNVTTLKISTTTHKLKSERRVLGTLGLSEYMAQTSKTYWSSKFAIVLAILINCCQSHNAYKVYTNGATSERNLPICNNPRTACNIIHKRFWLTPLVKRLCKCPDRTECSQKWSTDTDKYTVMLNGRAQMKFCAQVGDLRRCSGEETAITIESYNSTSIGLVNNVKINCYCPDWHYFNRKYKNLSTNTEGYLVKKEYYGCQKMKACAGGEFCGHITVNFYETYHKCSCPKQHICIMNNRRATYTTEALYEGLAYKGQCTYYES